jgi:integrase
MRTRTKGIHLDGTERIADKWYRGQRIYQRLGQVSQDDAETWLRGRQADIDAERAQQQAHAGAGRLWREGASKYLIECEKRGVRSLEVMSYHVQLLLPYIGELPMDDVCTEALAQFIDDRWESGAKNATVNRSLEVVRTVMNRAARVWRDQGRPWLGVAPLIEMLDETQQRRAPRPINWEEQMRLVPALASHLQRPVLFMLNTGARDENVCGLRWQWEVQVPEIERSVFVVPAAEFKSKRDFVMVLNDVAWSIVQACRGEHKEYVFTYRAPAPKTGEAKRSLEPHRIDTLNNTGWQRARAEAGLAGVRIHDLRHTYGQRLREAGVSEEDRALLLGHALKGMPQHYASATVARLVEAANKVQQTVDRTTLLRVVNG